MVTTLVLFTMNKLFPNIDSLTVKTIYIVSMSSILFSFINKIFNSKILVF